MIVLWVAWPLHSFLQLFTLTVVEKTLRTRFREVLSQAAVSGLLPGGCTCIQQHGCTAPREHSSDLGRVRNYCSSPFHMGKLG